MIARALSVRVICLSLIFGVSVGVFLQTVWPVVPLMPVVWLAAMAVYLLAVWGGEGAGQMVKCPRCGKRVKLGAVACHHCGYSGVDGSW